MIKTVCPLSMVMAHSLESCCLSGCQIVVRVVVRGLLSEWLLSEWCCQSGCCQSGCCQSGCCQGGCCQGGCCQSGCCQSGCCQSGYCQCCSLAGQRSKSATKLLHSSLLVIYTARNLPKRQPWDNPNVTDSSVGRTRKPKQRPKLWTQKRDPKPKNQPRRKKSADPKVESRQRSHITWRPLLHRYIEQWQWTGVLVGTSFWSRFHILDQHRDQDSHWQGSGEPPAHMALLIA